MHNNKFAQQKSQRFVSFHSDVDSLTSSGHKPTQYQTNLSIVEEGDNPDEKDKFLPHTNSNSHNSSIQKLKSEHTPNSSIEDITASNGKARNRTHLSPDGIHHENESGDGRRPSLILQYLRRPSVMATLRRSSIMSPFRSEPKDPNDPANRPEAIEQRLKNRRIGK
jgi:hypothetical protein